MKMMFVLCALVLAACGNSGFDVPASTKPTELVEPIQSTLIRDPVVVQGMGSYNSKPFRLDGPYRVSWIASPESSAGCYHVASLKRADGKALSETLANESISGNAPASGETYVSSLEATEYFIDVSSECSWTFYFFYNP